MARRIAPATVVGLDNQALVAAAEQVQPVADALVRVVAEAQVQRRLDVGAGGAAAAGRVGRLAVGLGQLLLVPGRLCANVSSSARPRGLKGETYSSS